MPDSPGPILETDSVGLSWGLGIYILEGAQFIHYYSVSMNAATGNCCLQVVLQSKRSLTTVIHKFWGAPDPSENLIKATDHLGIKMQ